MRSTTNALGLRGLLLLVPGGILGGLLALIGSGDRVGRPAELLPPEQGPTGNVYPLPGDAALEPTQDGEGVLATRRASSRRMTLPVTQDSVWLVSRRATSPFLYASYRRQRVDAGTRWPPPRPAVEPVSVDHWVVEERKGHVSRSFPWRGSLVPANEGPFVRGSEVQVLRLEEAWTGKMLVLRLNGLLIGEDLNPLSLIRGGKFRWAGSRFRGWVLFPGFMPARVDLRSASGAVPVVLRRVAWVRGSLANRMSSSGKIVLLASFPGSSHPPQKAMVQPDGSYQLGPVPTGSMTLELLGLPATLTRKSQTSLLQPGWQTLPPLEIQPSVALTVLAPGIPEGQRVWLSGWFDSYAGHREASKSPNWPSLEGVALSGGRLRFASVNAGKIAGHIWTDQGMFMSFGPLDLNGQAANAQIVLAVQQPGSLRLNPLKPFPKGTRFICVDDWYNAEVQRARVISSGRPDLRIRDLLLDDGRSVLLKRLWPVRYAWLLVSKDDLVLAQGLVEVQSHQTTVLDLLPTIHGASLILNGDDGARLRYALLSHGEGLVAKGVIPKAGKKILSSLSSGDYVLRVQRGADVRRLPIRLRTASTAAVTAWK